MGPKFALRVLAGVAKKTLGTDKMTEMPLGGEEICTVFTTCTFLAHNGPASTMVITLGNHCSTQHYSSVRNVAPPSNVTGIRDGGRGG